MFDVLDKEFHRLAEIRWEAQRKIKEAQNAKWNEEQRTKLKPGLYIPYRMTTVLFGSEYIRGSIFYHLEDIHETVKSFINPRHYEYTICPCCDHAWSEEEQRDIKCDREEGAPEKESKGEVVIPGQITYESVVIPASKDYKG